MRLTGARRTLFAFPDKRAREFEWKRIEAAGKPDLAPVDWAVADGRDHLKHTSPGSPQRSR